MKKTTKPVKSKTPEEIHALIVAREDAAHKAELARNLEKIRNNPKMEK